MDVRPDCRWSVSQVDLVDLDPLHARDLLIECFMAAQRETFIEAKGDLGLPIDEVSLKRSVESAVRGAFKEAGGDFMAPSKTTIGRAIDVLASSASAWGTPPEIVEHHHRELEKIVAHINE